MCPGKTGFGGVVAVEAKIRFSTCKKGWSIGGGVWAVAIQTAFFGRFMDNPGLLDSFLDLLMTLEAQFLPGGNQKIPIFAGVGIVTVRIVSLRDHIVNADGFRGQQIIMALKTDPLGLYVKKISMVRGVGIVALGTLPIFNGCMDVAKFHFLLKRLMTGQTQVSFSAGLEFGFVLSVCAQRQKQKSDEP